MIGLYVPGRSVLHRMATGLKLTLLLALLIALLLVGQLWWLGTVAGLVAAGYVLARIPIKAAAQQLAPLRWFVPIVVVAQGLLTSWSSAALVGGGLVVSVAAAALFTLTTRVSAMLDTLGRLLRPLRRTGVDPDRAGLVLALTIRCVPLLTSIVATVAEARKARGAGFSLRAAAAPAVVRALRTADQLGDALVARGVDD